MLGVLKSFGQKLLKLGEANDISSCFLDDTCNVFRGAFYCGQGPARVLTIVPLGFGRGLDLAVTENFLGVLHFFGVETTFAGDATGVLFLTLLSCCIIECEVLLLGLLIGTILIFIAPY